MLHPSPTCSRLRAIGHCEPSRRLRRICGPITCTMQVALNIVTFIMQVMSIGEADLLVRSPRRPLRSPEPWPTPRLSLSLTSPGSSARLRKRSGLLARRSTRSAGRLAFSPCPVTGFHGRSSRGSGRRRRHSSRCRGRARPAPALPIPAIRTATSASKRNRSPAPAGSRRRPTAKRVSTEGPSGRPKGSPTARRSISASRRRSGPTAPQGFRAAWRAYYAAMEDLAARIMRAFAVALDLPEAFFAPYINAPISALRALNYPALDAPPKPGQIRAGAHTDYGSLTILLPQAGSRGLQILSPEGDWVEVPPVPGAFVINIGDLMARWTNDRWTSTLHRVVIPEDGGAARRQSLRLLPPAKLGRRDRRARGLPRAGRDAQISAGAVRALSHGQVQGDDDVTLAGAFSECPARRRGACEPSPGAPAAYRVCRGPRRTNQAGTVRDEPWAPVIRRTGRPLNRGSLRIASASSAPFMSGII